MNRGTQLIARTCHSAVVKLVGKIGGIESIKIAGRNRNVPEDRIVHTIRGDYAPLRMCGRRRGLRGRSQRKQAVSKGIRHHRRVVRLEIDSIVPVGQSRVNVTQNWSNQLLLNLVIAKRVVLTQSVLVQQVDRSVL